MKMVNTITIAYGNGIGPEIMEALLYIWREVEAPVRVETIEIGERIHNMEEKTGILPHAWDSLINTRVLLKGPTASPSNTEYMEVDHVIKDAFSLDKSHLQTISNKLFPSITATSHINEDFALFETIKDTQINIAGKNTANPSSAFMAGNMLLRHIGAEDTADTIEQVWQETIEDGLVPYEFYSRGKGMKKLKTQAFTEEIAQRLGKLSFKQQSISV